MLEECASGDESAATSRLAIATSIQSLDFTDAVVGLAKKLLAAAALQNRIVAISPRLAPEVAHLHQLLPDLPPQRCGQPGTEKGWLPRHRRGAWPARFTGLEDRRTSRDPRSPDARDDGRCPPDKSDG